MSYKKDIAHNINKIYKEISNRIEFNMEFYI